MENKVAIITQSYKNDFRECKLLCESMDKFAPNIDHYIFVNDEDGIEITIQVHAGQGDNAKAAIETAGYEVVTL